MIRYFPRRRSETENKTAGVKKKGTGRIVSGGIVRKQITIRINIEQPRATKRNAIQAHLRREPYSPVLFAVAFQYACGIVIQLDDQRRVSTELSAGNLSGL